MLIIFIWEKEEREETPPSQAFCLVVCEKPESTISDFRAEGQAPGMMLFAQQKEL